MKKIALVLYSTLLLSTSLISSAGAAKQNYSPAQENLLKPVGKNNFMDNEGRVIYYPCTMGGEPLVIYSSVNNQPISSKATIHPAYMKKGYQASPLLIPSFETSEDVSNQNLIIQTINPPADYLSLVLTRTDNHPFYVDTANFPVVDVISGEEGTLQKYVSSFNVTINQAADTNRRTDLPIYNYNFVQDLGLFVYSEVTQIQARIATWNQNSDWTNGHLGSNYSNIAYRFAPLAVNDEVETYNGFGFWICGSDQKRINNEPKSQKSYIDALG